MALESPAKPLGGSSKPAAANGAGGMSYFDESRLPIYSAALVLPFLLIYEVGVALLRSDVINGGDAIVMRLSAPIIRYLGVSGNLVSVVVIVAAFVAWQVVRKGKWTIKPPVLTMMFFESLFFAVVLFMILGAFAHYIAEGPRPSNPRRNASLQERSPPSAPAIKESAASQPVPCSSPSRSSIEFRDFILYCGAGVFEELVFRVLLLGVLMLVLTRMLHMEHAYAAAWSVVIGAFVFSAFHHLGEAGDKFELNVFLQRLIAGLYFAALFYTRSFGVAAASHAIYDILVGLNRI